MRRSNTNIRLSKMEKWIQNKGRGLYRWERDEGWCERHGKFCDFEEGDAITIDPFKDRLTGSKALWPIYGTFREYVTEDIAKVYIPPESNDPCPTWFNEEAGEYLIHEGYLTPQ